MLATLQANHVAPADIESSRIDKQILTETDHDAVTVKGYNVSRYMSFTVHALEALVPIEQSLIRAPNVADLTCQFDRTDRAIIESELMTKALKSARDEADKLAGPLGRHVTAATAVSKSPFSALSGPLGFGDPYAAMPGRDRMFKRTYSANDLLVPLTIQLTVSVNVLFKME